MRLVQIQPKTVNKRRNLHIRRWAAMLFGAFILMCTILYFRPLPPSVIKLEIPTLPAPQTPSIKWPENSEASFGAKNYDIRMSNSQPKPISTASMAKVITVLCVLEKRPLKLGETGPVLTMTNQDVLRFQQQVEQGGSHLAIKEGDTLTQYQMLQAIMLRSANNVADSLAIWAFGSLEGYQKYAQDFVKRHGMNQTIIGPDASGLDDSTVSTTTDLTTLGLLAMENPVVMQIAGTSSATFATAGMVKNTNFLLGNGILSGLKTGMNEGNSGGFIFTSKFFRGNTEIPISGVVVNAGSSAVAVEQAEKLALSVADNFEVVSYIKAGQPVGKAKTAWGDSTTIYAKNSLELVRWRANRLWHTEKINKTNVFEQTDIGTLTIRTNGAKAETAIFIKEPIAKPSFMWRITHIR